MASLLGPRRADENMPEYGQARRQRRRRDGNWRQKGDFMGRTSFVIASLYQSRRLELHLNLSTYILTL